MNNAYELMVTLHIREPRLSQAQAPIPPEALIRSLPVICRDRSSCMAAM